MCAGMLVVVGIARDVCADLRDCVCSTALDRYSTSSRGGQDRHVMLYSWCKGQFVLVYGC